MTAFTHQCSQCAFSKRLSTLRRGRARVTQSCDAYRHMHVPLLRTMPRGNLNSVIYKAAGTQLLPLGSPRRGMGSWTRQPQKGNHIRGTFRPTSRVRGRHQGPCDLCGVLVRPTENVTRGTVLKLRVSWKTPSEVSATSGGYEVSCHHNLRQGNVPQQSKKG